MPVMPWVSVMSDRAAVRVSPTRGVPVMAAVAVAGVLGSTTNTPERA